MTRIGIVEIETRSRTKMFRVDRNGIPIGIVEKQPDNATDTNPWKARLGIGERNTFLGVIYAKSRTAGQQAIAREIAVNVVIAAFEGEPITAADFEPAYGAEAYFLQPGGAR